MGRSTQLVYQRVTQPLRQRHSWPWPIFLTTILQFKEFRLLLNLLVLVKQPNCWHQTLERLVGFGYVYWSYLLRSLGSILTTVESLQFLYLITIVTMDKATLERTWRLLKRRATNSTPLVSTSPSLLTKSLVILLVQINFSWL